MLIISMIWRGITALTAVSEIGELEFPLTEPVEMEHAQTINALSIVPVISIPVVVGLVVFQLLAHRRWRRAAGVLAAIGTFIVVVMVVLVVMGYLMIMIERSLWQ